MCLIRKRNCSPSKSSELFLICWARIAYLCNCMCLAPNVDCVSVPFSFMTYHLIYSQHNTTCATNRGWTGVSGFRSLFSMGLLLLNRQFSVLCFVDLLLFFFRSLCCMHLFEVWHLVTFSWYFV